MNLLRGQGHAWEYSARNMLDSMSSHTREDGKPLGGMPDGEGGVEVFLMILVTIAALRQCGEVCLALGSGKFHHILKKFACRAGEGSPKFRKISAEARIVSELQDRQK